MKYEYQPKGVCARKIYLDVEDGVVKEVAFEGGCDGNHKGLCALVKDMPCEAVSDKLSGIQCGINTARSRVLWAFSPTPCFA